MVLFVPGAGDAYTLTSAAVDEVNEDVRASMLGILSALKRICTTLEDISSCLKDEVELLGTMRRRGGAPDTAQIADLAQGWMQLKDALHVAEESIPKCIDAIAVDVSTSAKKSDLLKTQKERMIQIEIIKSLRRWAGTPNAPRIVDIVQGRTRAKDPLRPRRERHYYDDFDDYDDRDDYDDAIFTSDYYDDALPSPLQPPSLNIVISLPDSVDETGSEFEADSIYSGGNSTYSEATYYTARRLLSTISPLDTDPFNDDRRTLASERTFGRESGWPAREGAFRPASVRDWESSVGDWESSVGDRESDGLPEPDRDTDEESDEFSTPPTHPRELPELDISWDTTAE